MVFAKADKDTKLIIVNCNCGCEEEIHLKKYTFDEEIQAEDEYYLTIHTGKFDSLQRGIFRTIGQRLKAIWKILRGKEYYFTEIVMSKREFEEFKKEVEEM